MLNEHQWGTSRYLQKVRGVAGTFKSHVSFDDLLKDALRFRPDRIILGEIRGVEARTLLDSFNTGLSGSLATIHANSAEKALCRFANLAMRGHAQTTYFDTEAEIAEAVDFVVHVERQTGQRTIREVLHSMDMTGAQNSFGLNRFTAVKQLPFRGV
jgi:Flp pilus assembly CpaF family ATPase